MSGQVGEAFVRLRPNTLGFQQEATSSLTRAVKGIALAVGGAFAAQKIFTFGAEAIQTAASIQKSQESITETMGKAGRDVKVFNDKASSAFLLSAKDADNFSARIGLMGQNIGLSHSQTAQMAVELEKLAGSFGTIKGQDPTPFLDKLSTALIGNTRGLKQLGIAVTPTNELLEAERLGFIKTTVDANKVAEAHARVTEYTRRYNDEVKKYGAGSSQAAGATAELKGAQDQLSSALAGKPSSTVSALTAAQKAQVIMGVATGHLGSLMQEAKKHSGDLADQQVRLTAEWSNAKDEVGIALLPAVTKLATVFAKNLPGAMHEFASAMKQGIHDIQPIVPPLVSAFTDLFNLIKDNKGVVVDLVGAFIAYRVAMKGINEAMLVYNDVAKIAGTVTKILSGQMVFQTGAVTEQQAVMAGAAAGQEAYAAQVAIGADAQVAATAATEAATAAQEGLDAALVANPIGLVIAAVAALALGMYELYQRSATARAIMQTAFRDIKAAGQAAFGYLAHIVLPDAIGAFHSLESMSRSVLSAIERFWQHWGKSIIREAKIVFAPMIATVHVGMDLMKEIFTTIGDIIHGRWHKLWGDLGHIVGTILGGMIRILLTSLGTLLKLTVQAASYLVPAAVHLFAAVVKAAWNEWTRLPGQILHLLRGIPGDMEKAVPVIVSEAVKLGKQLVSGIISGVGSLAGDLKDSLEGEVKKGLGSLNPFSPIEHGGELYIGNPIVAGAVNAISSSSSGLRPQLTSSIGSALQSTVKSAHQWVNQNTPSIGVAINSGVVQPVQSLGSKLGNTIVSQAQAAISAAKKALGISSPSMVFANEVGRPISDGILHGMGGLEAGLTKQITTAAKKSMASLSGGLTGGPHGSAATGANQRLGYQMMLRAGWGADQWGALQALWNRESGWNQYAKNASSGAYGIPQSLPANKMASAGSDWLTNPATQIAWGLSYIRGRYGSPGGAWAHEGQYGWYGDGGVVPGPYRGAPVIIGAHAGETVLPTHKDHTSAGVNIENLTVVSTSPHVWGQASDVMNGIARKLRK